MVKKESYKKVRELIIIRREIERLSRVRHLKPFTNKLAMQLMYKAWEIKLLYALVTKQF